jgi:alpha-D-ribose 1-methylphosphonate 5-triphosphate synthase subunit PhnH
MTAGHLEGGFSDPAIQAAHGFRAVMEAMARPGSCHDVAGATPPVGLSPAAGTVLLTLCDPETPVFLAGEADCAGVRDWLAFHTGAPLTDPATCAFAVGGWAALQPLSRYPKGRAQYPDRSATLIVELEALSQSGARLTGPGIATEAALSLPETAAFQDNRTLYPLGLDFIFTCGNRLAALPRTTEVR